MNLINKKTEKIKGFKNGSLRQLFYWRIVTLIMLLGVVGISSLSLYVFIQIDKESIFTGESDLSTSEELKIDIDRLEEVIQYFNGKDERRGSHETLLLEIKDPA
ncbi:hypothetical protein GW765_00265 [Candidatus Parcubacteria bacterium]|nr:hypothetical protein [Candidatus Parcubacteria bacterium]